MPIINQVVSGSGGGSSVTEPYLEFDINSSGSLVHSTTTSHIIDLSGCQYLDHAEGISFTRLYYNNQNISGVVDFSDVLECQNGLEAIEMFRYCGGITSFKMSKLEKISASTSNGWSYFLANCPNLVSVDLGNLYYVNGAGALSVAFMNDTSLTSVNLDSFRGESGGHPNSIFYQIFYGCTALVTMKFPSLRYCSGQSYFGYAFQGCTSLQSVWFYALNSNSFGSRTNQFNNMLYGCTDVTVHFPSNLQSVIGSWADVTNGFGGTNTTILWDLPATVTLTGADSKTYERNPKYDTATALAWVCNYDYDTPFYTSGITDPSVADTIYSDDACTQSVTTITAIA